MSRLFVNIDHIATLREARKTQTPSVLEALFECQLAGIQGVTIHLREDERHIKKKDVYDIKSHKTILMNLESSVNERIVEVVCDVQPEMTCIVPERREEITTEGGLDVLKLQTQLKSIIERHHRNGIEVSLFIEANKEVIALSSSLGADAVEIHTGRYANASYQEKQFELDQIMAGIDFAYDKGLKVNLGHGLNYQNIHPLLGNQKVSEFNIGHSIVSQALFTGFREAVLEMKRLVEF